MELGLPELMTQNDRTAIVSFVVQNKGSAEHRSHAQHTKEICGHILHFDHRRRFVAASPCGNTTVCSEINRSDSGNGKARSNTPLTTLNIAVVAPIPNASVSTMIRLNLRFVLNCRSAKTKSRCIQKTPGIYLLSLLSGYKPNRISWLELSSNSDWESNASNTCKMGTFSRLVMLKICRIW